MAADDFTHRVQVAALLQVQHLTTNEHRGFREPANSDRAQNGIRFDGDVVIHVEDERAIGRTLRIRIRTTQGLVHNAGVPARTTEISLREDTQAVTKVLGDSIEARLVCRMLGALVRHQNSVDNGIDFRIRGQRLKSSNCIGRAIERRDTDSDAPLRRRMLRAVRVRLARRLDIGVPTCGVDYHVRLTGEVEPNPAAVFKLRQRYWDFANMHILAVHLGFCAFSRCTQVTDNFAGHGDTRTVNLRTVDVHARGTGQLQAQDNIVQIRPPAPVAGRKRIEVGFKTNFITRRNGG